MFAARNSLFLLGGLVVAAAVAVFLSSARPGFFPSFRTTEKAAPPGTAALRPGSALGKEGAASSASRWTPPQGDPVLRFRELRSAPAQARKDLIANFMALGHDRNSYLLIEALRDADPGVRLFAVESASSLSLGEATAVLAAASSDSDPGVREMTWSLAAPYPVESRATIFSGALRQGDDTTLNEAFAEMRIRPEKALFEMMLTEAIRPGVDTARQTVLLGELQSWLEPGGGNVPKFENPPQMADWWRANLVHYDEFLLRTDPNP